MTVISGHEKIGEILEKSTGLSQGDTEIRDLNEFVENTIDGAFLNEDIIKNESTLKYHIVDQEKDTDSLLVFVKIDGIIHILGVSRKMYHKEDDSQDDVISYGGCDCILSDIGMSISKHLPVRVNELVDHIMKYEGDNNISMKELSEIINRIYSIFGDKKIDTQLVDLNI